CARSQPVDSLFLSSPTQPPTASYTLSLHDALPIYAPDDVRLRRRISRDTIERGRTPDAVVAQCRSTVFPAHSRYVEPTRARADLVLLNAGRLEPVVAVATAVIRSELARRPGGSGIANAA